MKRFAMIILLVLASVAVAGTVSYPARPQGGGPITRTAVWSFDRNDVNEVRLDSGPIYGHLQRIVIEAAGTDTAWGLSLTDDHGVTLFSKADLSSASVPYSYALIYQGLDPNHWAIGIPSHGPMAVRTSNVAATKEVQTLTMTGNAIDGTFTLSYRGRTTAAIAYNANTAEIQTALNALVPTDSIVVSGADLANTGTTVFTFDDVNHADAPMLEIDTSVLGRTAEVQTLTSADATRGSFRLTYGGATTPYVEEMIQIADVNDPNGGTFKLTFGGQETAAIAYDANAIDIKTALEALSTIEANEVVVASGPLPDLPVTVRFTEGLGGQNVGAVTLSTNSLTSGESGETAAYEITVLREGAGLVYNASTATIQAAIEALSTVNTGDITVGGTTLAATGTTTFTFRAALGDVGMLGIDISNLAGPSAASFAETVKGVLAAGTFAETAQGGSDLTSITVTVYYLGNGN